VALQLRERDKRGSLRDTRERHKERDRERDMERERGV